MAQTRRQTRRPDQETDGTELRMATARFQKLWFADIPIRAQPPPSTPGNFTPPQLSAQVTKYSVRLLGRFCSSTTSWRKAFSLRIQATQALLNTTLFPILLALFSIPQLTRIPQCFQHQTPYRKLFRLKQMSHYNNCMNTEQTDKHREKQFFTECSNHARYTPHSCNKPKR